MENLSILFEHITGKKIHFRAVFVVEVILSHFCVLYSFLIIQLQFQ